MKTKLITALRTSANALETGSFDYNWSKPSSCNCGIIACALMGKSISQMEAMVVKLTDSLEKDNHTWKNIIAHHCPITGLPENEILKSLIQAGMSQADIIELEFLSNKDVQAMAVKQQGENAQFYSKEVKPTFWGRIKGEESKYVSTGKYRYSKKENTIAYMRAWADLLTEQGALDNVSGQQSEAVLTPPTRKE